jgi:fructose-1,6-bisphosphatase/inositol monophosphatase family enzyme
VPLFGTLIGVEHAGRCVAGVIHLPALKETVFGGVGLGATHRVAGLADRAARVSGVRELADAVLVTTSIDYYRRAGYESLYSRCSSVVSMTRGWSDAYGFLLVATGRADVIVEPLVKAWDVAAIYPVIEAAGGVSCDFSGGTDIDAGHVVSGNAAMVSAMMNSIQMGSNQGGLR